VSDADDVLAHSEDEGEWDDQPVAAAVRPSGSQVLSARIPAALADQVFEEAARRGVSMSEVVRAAIEDYFTPRLVHVLTAQPGERVRIFIAYTYDTANPVVTVNDLPPLRQAM
jgi:hypothetical protein